MAKGTYLAWLGLVPLLACASDDALVDSQYEGERPTADPANRPTGRG